MIGMKNAHCLPRGGARRGRDRPCRGEVRYWATRIIIRPIGVANPFRSECRVFFWQAANVPRHQRQARWFLVNLPQIRDDISSRVEFLHPPIDLPKGVARRNEMHVRSWAVSSRRQYQVFGHPVTSCGIQASAPGLRRTVVSTRASKISQLCDGSTEIGTGTFRRGHIAAIMPLPASRGNWRNSLRTCSEPRWYSRSRKMDGSRTAQWIWPDQGCPSCRIWQLHAAKCLVIGCWLVPVLDSLTGCPRLAGPRLWPAIRPSSSSLPNPGDRAAGQWSAQPIACDGPQGRH